MILIAAVDKNWAIGKNNKMMWSIPGDMRFFQEKTTGHVVVMGRKTLESFPGGLPLKNRTNIVLTKNRAYRAPGAAAVHTIEELHKKLEAYAGEEVFVIGGGSVYRQLLPDCDTAYITKIDHVYEADTYFPNLDEMPEWEITEVSEEQTSFDLEYIFTKYERKK